MNKKNSGQSVLELAIFGGIILMLLGTLISYGLRYNNEQQTMMRAFRKALYESRDEDRGYQGSYTLIRDRHIPDPGNMFGIGQVMPASASANVIRSVRLHETPDWGKYQDLPQTTIEIKGDRSNIYTFKTAGFRSEGDIPCQRTIEVDAGGYEIVTLNTDLLEKFQEIYGEGNVISDYVRNCNDTSISSAEVRVIDSCEGEIINYDACKRQCRMITDYSFCVNECNAAKPPDSSRDCNAVCGQSIPTPWYCGQMDNIFSFASAANKRKTMGVQGDYDKVTTVDNTLTKIEAGGRINTIDRIDFHDTTNRDIISNRHLDAQGIASPSINRQNDPDASEVSVTN